MPSHLRCVREGLVAEEDERGGARGERCDIGGEGEGAEGEGDGG